MAEPVGRTVPVPERRTEPGWNDEPGPATVDAARVASGAPSQGQSPGLDFLLADLRAPLVEMSRRDERCEQKSSSSHEPC